MKTLDYRLPTSHRLAYWSLALGTLLAVFLVYLFVFFLPYQGIDLRSCPQACSYSSDCWVPGCSRKTECSRGRCEIASGHGKFLSASLLFLLFFAGLAFTALAAFKQSLRLVLDDKGLHLYRLDREIHVSWDDFLGISYHGVHTRFGRDATVFSITGDNGLFSFLVPGLPPATHPRDLELGAIFFHSLTKAECDELAAVIKEKTGASPEAEHEW